MDMAQSFQVAPPDSFVFTKPNEWPKWIRRFERYLLASGLDGKPDAMQVNALVYAIADEADDIMAGFGLTEEEREVYQTVKTKFDEHFVVRRSTLFERAKFNRRCQEEGENVDRYITSLFCLAEHCEYGALHDEMIRDRIVVGIVDSSLSLKLQLDSKLTLKKPIDAARQSEAAKREQAQMRNFLPKATNVDFVKAKRQSRSHPMKPKMAAKPQSTNRKCNFCGRSPAKRRCVQPEKQRASTVAKSVILVSCVDQRSPLMRSPKHPDPEVAFLGEVTKNDDPWTSTVVMEAMGTQCRADICFKLDTGADVTVISQSDYRRAGSPSLDASTKRLLGANDNVLQTLGKFNGRQGGAVVDEDIYIISGQRRSLLSRRAGETLNLVKLVAVDSVETADYYKDKNPTLFGGFGRKYGGDYSIQLREDAVPFALSTPQRVSIPLMGAVKRELQGMEDLQVIRRVDTPTDWCAGIVVVTNAGVVASSIESAEKETNKVRICVDLTKLNESVMREKHDLPSVDQTRGRLAGAKVFTKLDANSGFW